MLVEKIFIGTWFQRTTLHLSETYDFLRHGTSQLKLDKQKLQRYREGLNLESVEYDINGMEYLKIVSREKVEIEIFEDGLIVLSTAEKLEITPENLKANLKFLAAFYEQQLSPALAYLFSLGAPVPKELANIKIVYPYFFVFDHAPKKEIEEFLLALEPEKYFEVSNEKYDLFRGNRYYIVNRKKISLAVAKNFIEEQIFLREFKGQLHRYVNIHRIVWEKVDKIKDKKRIKGREIESLRQKIESYAKTINLIETRINQMKTYLQTREKLACSDQELTPFMESIEYRYETLMATLKYCQYLWEMTKNHVDSALALLKSLQQEVTNTSIENLTVVTAVGVGASVLGLFTTTEMPQFTIFGLFYFVGLLCLGYVINFLIQWYNNRRSYDYTDAEYDTNIK